MQQIFNRKFFIFFGSIIFAEFFTLNVIADEVKIETEKSEEIKPKTNTQKPKYNGNKKKKYTK